MKNFISFLWVILLNLGIGCRKGNDEITIVIEDTTIEKHEKTKNGEEIKQRTTKRRRLSLEMYVERFENYIKGNAKNIFLRDLDKLEQTMERKIKTEKNIKKKKKYERILLYTRILKKEVEKRENISTSKKIKQKYDRLKKEIKNL